jgi:hypothetical protein
LITDSANVMKHIYYLLFDKNGVMVNFGLLLRPSIPETKVDIEKLLEE